MTYHRIEGQITFLYTNILDETSKFYEEVIGLDLVLDQGKCRIYQAAEGGYIGFCQRSTSPVDPSNLIITLVTTNVDEWYERLVKKGVVFEKSPQENPDYNLCR